ncbi:cation:H+ antiporter [Desulfitispora alkaliphila]
MLNVFLLLSSLIVILMGAHLFTNGIEWLGKRLKLAEGAVGSILAAVGTALPETMIPVIAILLGSKSGEDIGIGAILGAPFMLATLAMGIVGISIIIFKRRRLGQTNLNINPTVMRRDLSFFLVAYTVAISATFIANPLFRNFIAVLLVLIYVIYVWLTLRDNNTLGEAHLKPLFLARKVTYPKLKIILIQIIIALAMIIIGAHGFVNAIKSIAEILQVPGFILALIIAPVATELPEKFNSIIWVRSEKDTLAMGNITGAMVFQSSLIPALGITMTKWELTNIALVSASFAILSASVLLLSLKLKGKLTAKYLLMGIPLYILFVIIVLTFDTL